MFHILFNVSIVNFGQVNVPWENHHVFKEIANLKNIEAFVNINMKSFFQNFFIFTVINQVRVINKISKYDVLKIRSSHQMCSLEKCFFKKISKSLQENTCARVSFEIKLQASGLQLFLKKKDSGTTRKH